MHMLPFFKVKLKKQWQNVIFQNFQFVKHFQGILIPKKHIILCCLVIILYLKRELQMLISHFFFSACKVLLVLPLSVAAVVEILNVFNVTFCQIYFSVDSFSLCDLVSRMYATCFKRYYFPKSPFILNI